MSTTAEQDIAALKQRVYKLEAQVNQLYRHLGITFSEQGNPAEDSQIIAALRVNNMTLAVKLYREKTGVGLAEAKSVMEALRAGLDF